MSNLLAREISPYLQQHAGNPVHWFPWGQEAFAKAKAENKPILLSVGYSTCHWCHVMAHESFEDEQVAQLLNRYFISIKVDREERPDVDAVYMQVCQAMTGSGGWPLTVFMTPDQEPFFAGTYYPKTSAYGRTGFLDLLDVVSKKWQENPASLITNGQQVKNAFAKMPSQTPGKMTRELFQSAKAALEKVYDSSYGGFGSAPKFPSPHILMFLMHYAALEKDAKALKMVEKTLYNMYRGGIFDVIGGGFSRYATDRQWRVPHFEKMLYDNALLAMAYTQAFQLTGKDTYASVAQATLDYALREMLHSHGGFFSAQDADSDGEEGAYYVWTPEEVEKVLGKDQGHRVCVVLGITEEGNFEGKSIPNLQATSQENLENLRLSLNELYDYRRHRKRLATDDKILTAWNGLMIAALAKATAPLNRPDYLKAALSADEFANKYLTKPSGELFVHWREGTSVGTGTLEDYAFLAWAKLCLYEATFCYRHLKEAERLAQILLEKFFDSAQGGFFMNVPEAGLIFRPKEIYDGAIPSGSAVAAYVLWRLARLTENESWKKAALAQLNRIAGAASSHSSGHCFGLLAGMETCYPPVDILCVAREEETLHTFLHEVGKQFLPVGFMLGKPSDAPKDSAPAFLNTYNAAGHPAVYYVCHDLACQAPVFTLRDLVETLESGGIFLKKKLNEH